MTQNNFRTETDSMGEMKVPADAYYGAQTARAVENFSHQRPAFPAAVHPRAGAHQKARRGHERRAGLRPGEHREGRPAGRAGGHRGQMGSPVRRGHFPDRLRHLDEHEHERGHRQPRHRDSRRESAATSRCIRTTTSIAGSPATMSSRRRCIFPRWTPSFTSSFPR